MGKKIAAGIVLYNPDIERLKQNIKAIVHQVDELILVDNYSNNLKLVQNLLKQYGDKKITIVENKENLGIATALNQMLSVAKEKNYEWCLTLDQDSVVPDNIIQVYLNFLENNINLKNKIGILCPQTEDVNKDDVMVTNNSYNYIEKCITSGSLTSVSKWEKVGRFDDSMFIDEVDHDFCYRLRKNSYYIIRINSIVMSHELGNIKYKNIMGLKLKSMNHSAFRKYYIARNITYVDMKYYGTVKPKSYLRLFKQLILVFLVEEEKLNKTHMFIKGYLDGRKILEIKK